MLRLLSIVILSLSFSIIASINASLGDDNVLEAQRILSSLGYDPGPSDGVAGKRTISAIEAFAESLGTRFDGTIDDEELLSLRSYAADIEPILRFPGRLFDASHGKATKCNALEPARFHEAAAALEALEPISKLNDSVSIGGSPLWDQIDPWLKMVLTEAALYDTTGNAQAGERALAQLHKWALADAVLKTPVDGSYNGKGSLGSYRPSASAPVLDMENAAQLGYAVYYATAMLDGLNTSRLDVVRDWANRLTEKYGRPIGDSIFASNPTGIWRLEGRPVLTRAIMAGDADTYRKVIEAYYRVIRKAITSSGAILKNANRGDRALLYQSQGLLSVAAILDVVENQGGKIPLDIEAKFHKAVAFMLDSDRDIKVVAKFAREGYNNNGNGSNMVRFYRENSEHYWWMYYYISKYPHTENADRLRYFLHNNDTFERDNVRMMASTWVPYPVNCYRPFDMSDQAVSRATQIVEAKYPETAESGPSIASRGTGGIGATGALEVASASLREQFRERNFVEYRVQIISPTLDGEVAYIPSFSIFTDFSGSAEKASNLQLFRLAIKRGQLRGADSRDASYLSCGDLSASINGPDELLKLHVGPGSEKNKCLLQKMEEKDRVIWSAVLANFGDLLDQMPAGGAADRVRELYALVK